MFKRKPIRAYIEGVVYDTSMAKKVLEYREYNCIYGYYIKYVLYKGENKWFTVRGKAINPIEEWKVKEILVQHDIDKFIEYFGEVEYA